MHAHHHHHHPHPLELAFRAMTGPRERGGPGRGRGRGGPGRHGGPFGGGPFGFPRGGRARRGDVRAALLVLLSEEPRNGYGLMQEIERRTQGVWKPSPGSVYPALQQLEDEGLVRSEERDDRRVYALTDAGRAEVERRGSDAPAPWDAVTGEVDDDAMALWGGVKQIGIAVAQIAATGSGAQIAAARKVLADARRALYAILAEDGEDEPDEPQEA